MSLAGLALKTLDTHLGYDRKLHTHSQVCAKIALKLYEKAGLEPVEKVINTVLLHEIGNSNLIKFSNNFKENAFALLKNSSDVYARAILNHSTNTYDFESSELEQYVTMVIDYCETHTDEDGFECTLDEKIKKTIERYGSSSKEVEELLNLYDYYIGVELDIFDTIKKIDKFK